VGTAAVSGCDFSDADLAQINFTGADLQGAILKNVSAPTALFVEAKLDGADFTGASLAQSIFVDAKASGASFNQANMQQCIMHRADCSRSRFEGTDLTYADFSHATLQQSLFSTNKMFRTVLHQVDDAGAHYSNRAQALGDDPDKKEAEQWEAKF